MAAQKTAHGADQTPKSMAGVPQVLAHNPKDNVAVVVVEGLTAGTDALGLVTENDTTFRVAVKEDVPIGHKVALTDLKIGDTVIKYGQDIGRVVAADRERATTCTFTISRRRGGRAHGQKNMDLGISSRERPRRRAQSRRHPAAR